MKKLAIILGLVASTSVIADESSREFYGMMGAGFSDEHSTAPMLTIGGQIHNRWSLESTMIFIHDDYSTTHNDGLHQKSDYDTFVFSLTPVYAYPLNENIDLYGKGGVQYTKTKLTTKYNVEVNKDEKFTKSNSDFGFTYGFGLQYTTTQPVIGNARLMVRAGVDWYKADFNTVTDPVYGLQAGFKF